jgi:hypothetical protein
LKAQWKMGRIFPSHIELLVTNVILENDIF